jgi:alkanesulfonate monooxygenase SsuD/methylene tetrahydromethanopterin reductase-like flavin-dependent oxidoreductase (luciferase family)
MLYFHQTLFSHANISNVQLQMQTGNRREADYDYIRPEHREGFLRALQGFRQTTLADLERSERLAWGTPEQVRDTLIELANTLGAGTVMLNFNQGAMPHELFVRNVERFGLEVLPVIQAHQVTTVPLT